MVTLVVNSLSCFFRRRGKCRKLWFWHIFDHNSRTTRHMEVLIKYWIPWLILHKTDISCEKNILQFFSKTNKNMAPLVSPINISYVHFDMQDSNDCIISINLPCKFQEQRWTSKSFSKKQTNKNQRIQRGHETHSNEDQRTPKIDSCCFLKVRGPISLSEDIYSKKSWF